MFVYLSDSVDSLIILKQCANASSARNSRPNNFFSKQACVNNKCAFRDYIIIIDTRINLVIYFVFFSPVTSSST